MFPSLRKQRDVGRQMNASEVRRTPLQRNIGQPILLLGDHATLPAALAEDEITRAERNAGPHGRGTAAAPRNRSITSSASANRSYVDASYEYIAGARDECSATDRRHVAARCRNCAIVSVFSDICCDPGFMGWAPETGRPAAHAAC